MSNPSDPNDGRIDAPLCRDDESLREYGSQVAMDGLMQQALSTRRENHGPNVVLKLRWWKPRVWIPAAAAALVAVAGLALRKFRDRPSAHATLDPRWVLLAASGADYCILDPNRFELRKGDLRFNSLQPASLVVDTPLSMARLNAANLA